MQLEGTLDTFPLRELIEMVIYSSVTGMLEVQTGAGNGQIYFRDGRPYHAVAGEHSGIAAIGALFEEQRAPFRFVADRVAPDATLWMDPWDMIDHGEELARQWQFVRRSIPTVAHVPRMAGAEVQGQVHINEMVWPVLSAIDGQRSVIEISGFLNLVLLDTCLALAGLIEQGLVKLGPPRAPQPLLVPAAAPAHAAPPTPLPSAPAASDGGGFLERMLAEAKAREQQRPDLTDDQAQERKQVYRYVDDRR